MALALIWIFYLVSALLVVATAVALAARATTRWRQACYPLLAAILALAPAGLWCVADLKDNIAWRVGADPDIVTYWASLGALYLLGTEILLYQGVRFSAQLLLFQLLLRRKPVGAVDPPGRSWPWCSLTLATICAIATLTVTIAVADRNGQQRMAVVAQDSQRALLTLYGGPRQPDEAEVAIAWQHLEDVWRHGVPSEIQSLLASNSWDPNLTPIDSETRQFIQLFEPVIVETVHMTATPVIRLVNAQAFPLESQFDWDILLPIIGLSACEQAARGNAQDALDRLSAHVRLTDMMYGNRARYFNAYADERSSSTAEHLAALLANRPESIPAMTLPSAPDFWHTIQDALDAHYEESRSRIAENETVSRPRKSMRLTPSCFRSRLCEATLRELESSRKAILESLAASEDTQDAKSFITLPRLKPNVLRFTSWRVACLTALSITYRNLTLTGWAALRFHADQQFWPKTLDDLVPRYLDAVPQDIWDGAPLRSKAVPDGFIIYSVGENGIDDGGQDVRPAHGPDISFFLGSAYEDYKKAMASTPR